MSRFIRIYGGINVVSHVEGIIISKSPPNRNAIANNKDNANNELTGETNTAILTITKKILKLNGYIWTSKCEITH